MSGEAVSGGAWVWVESTDLSGWECTALLSRISGLGKEEG